MLPKVATHLLHTTTRSAAAAVHGQTSTLRNVLQSGATGPSGANASTTKQKSKPTAASGPSTSSAVKPVTIALVTASGSFLPSSASPSGPQQQQNQSKQGSSDDASSGENGGGRSKSGPKGNNNPKAGRRFYTNYNSASRAVTQANAIIVTEDVPGFQSSVADDGPILSASFSSSTQERRALLTASTSKPTGQSRTRLRSSSVNSLLPRNEKDKDGASMAVMEKISVLKTVQAQARSFHVLSAAAGKAVSSSTDQSSPSATEVPVQVDVAAPPPAVDLAASIPRAPSPATTPAPLRPASPLPRARSPIQRRNSTSSIRSSSPLSFVEVPTEVQVQFTQVRRNSTVGSATTKHEAKDAKEAPQPIFAAEPSSPSMSDVSASPSQASETLSTSTRASSAHGSAEAAHADMTPSQAPPAAKKIQTKYGVRIHNARLRGDPAAVAEAVRDLLDCCADAARKEKQGLPAHVHVTIADFNNALSALLATRTEGQSLEPILDVYRAILATGELQAKVIGSQGQTSPVKPSLKTYTLLIEAFTRRDWEIYRLLMSLDNSKKGRELRASAGLQSPVFADEGQSPEERRIKALQEESKSNLANALKLFEALMEVGGREVLDGTTFRSLLRSCATHGNIKAALRVFEQWERRAGTVPVYGKHFWRTGQVPQPLPQGTSGPDSEAYRFLIQAFTNADDYEGASLVFEGFKKKWEEGLVYTKGTKFKVERGQIQVWNQMLEMYFRKGEPEAAVDLLDSMLKASVERKEQPATDSQEEGHWMLPVVPAPANSTFTTMIGGFVKMGDVSTAYAWFNRLLQENDSPNDDPFVGALDGRAMKPDQVAWTIMLDALATEKRIDDLNNMFTRLVAGPSGNGLKGTGGSDEHLAEDGVRVLRRYRHLVYVANMEWLKESSASTHEEMEKVLQHLNFIRDTVIPSNPTSSSYKAESIKDWDFDANRMMDGLSKMYIKFGAIGQAYHLIAPYVTQWSDCFKNPANTRLPEGAAAQLDLQNLVIGFWESTLSALRPSDALKELSWNAASGLALLNMRLGLKVTPEQAAWLLHAYGQVSVHGDGLDVPAELYNILLGCAVHVDSAPNSELLAQAGIVNFAFKGTGALLQDIAARGFRFDNTLTDPQTRFEAVEVIARGHDLAWGRNFFGSLGETYLLAFEQHAQRHYASIQEQIDEAAPQEQRIDTSVTPQPLAHSVLLQSLPVTKEVDGALKDVRAGSQEERTERAYAAFHSALTKGHVPHVPSFGKLIQACGRLGQLDRVQEVYHVAQKLIANLRGQMGDSKRRELWVMIEDSMIIALAHAGDVHGAHVHRRRILEFGGINEVAPGTPPANSMLAVPSADAYGALVLHVTDTTDDASNALMLWNEAMSVGVVPNLYLFNNIISKLSRARKADSALELFHMMKDQGITPSSITYGAVIGACARVGDVASAETLFKEMTEQSNFKPRVPPFNTMMQVYTSTKPNRERALHYYNEMQSMRVQPTAHTYKLLLDLYGSVEPLDIASMESTWAQLKSNRHVELQGTHFASLINAYGCVLKDVDRAIAIFDSIPSHIVKGKPLTPDAVVYEAIVNTLVANRRTDLIPVFMERMSRDKVHMTAYVANFLIKGYANVGDVEQARTVFESMRDPPTGVAAPNNHAPHDPSSSPEAVGVMDPVYREPSTWEAMIRAELGAGNRDRAYNLLERLKVRQYPEAVFNRISGVMVDHTSVVV